MRWFTHGNLTPAAREAIVRHKHSVENEGDVFPEGVPAFEDVFKRLASKQLDLITTDKAIVQHVYDEKLKLHRSVVFLQLAGGDVEQDDAIDRLFERYKSPKPGMLYTVTESRVKVRQLPGM